MFGGMSEAVGTLLSGPGILALVLGTLVGLVVSVLPGVSGVNAMALLLPVTFTMETGPAMVFLVAIMAAGGFAGSITSILLNVPGDPTNAATCLDGYPLARMGKASVAIAASATASAIGAVIGLMLLALSVPLLRDLIMVFDYPELFALSVAGILLIAGVAGGPLRKGLIAGAFGMMLGAIGQSTVNPVPRFTGGAIDLYDGIPQIAAIIGLFALPELYNLMMTKQSVAGDSVIAAGGAVEGIRETLRRPGLVLRSGAIGTVLGIIPGVGGTVAGWMAYFAARRSTKDPKSFGKGNIEGVIAPDAALNSKEGASMMPLLALGVPGSLSTAVLLSAFNVKGIAPGKSLFEDEMGLIWSLILAMVVVNVATSLLGLVGANHLVKVTKVPAHVLVPVVLVLTLLGSYVETQALLAIVVAFVLGLIGIVMVRYGYPRAPLLIGYILFGLAEENFFHAKQIYRGSYEFLLRPITLGIIVGSLLVLLVPFAWRWWVSRREAQVDADLQVIGEEEALDDHTQGSGLSEIVISLCMLVMATGFILAAQGYSAQARSFPMIVLVVLVAVSLFSLGAGVRIWRRRRGDQVPPTGQNRVGRRNQLVVLAWIIAFPVVFVLLGGIVGVFAYVAAFVLIRRPGRPDVRAACGALVIAAVVTAVVYFGYQDYLGVYLPNGIFG